MARNSVSNTEVVEDQTTTDVASTEENEANNEVELSDEHRGFLSKLDDPTYSGAAFRSSNQLGIPHTVLRELEDKGLAISDCAHDDMKEPATNIGWRITKAGALALRPQDEPGTPKVPVDSASDTPQETSSSTYAPEGPVVA